ncbi:MAG: glycine zipper family protein [Geminicoccaceae bacterium]
MRRRPTMLFAFAALLPLAGCSAPSPVLYPNARLNEVGQAQANSDIEACKQMAAAGGANAAEGHGSRAARNTAVGGAAGGATGAVGGAVLGNAGRGAAFGAATGATAGLMRSIFSRPKPSGAYMNFVDRCLREKGYEPVGWD